MKTSAKRRPQPTFIWCAQCGRCVNAAIAVNGKCPDGCTRGYAAGYPKR